MVYVIILNWNGADDTIKCLKSLGCLDGLLPKVIVCDNNSTDDSWSKIEDFLTHQTRLEIQLVQTGLNLGFAAGNNVGLHIALSDSAMDFVWLLNNDTLVAPGALIALKRYMYLHTTVGVCGPTLLYADEPNRIQAVGGRYNPWLGVSEHVLGNQLFSPTLCQTVNRAELDYVVGASMFIRREVIEKLGFLSENYFLYYEEIDFAMRLKREMPHLTIGYAHDSLVFHKEGASTKSSNRLVKTYCYFSDFFFITSRLKFSRKFYPLHSLVVQASMLLVALRRIRSGQFRSALVALCCFCGVIPNWLDPR